MNNNTEFETLKNLVHHPKLMEHSLMNEYNMDDFERKARNNPKYHPNTIFLTFPDYETADDLRKFVAKGGNAITITITGYHFEVVLSLNRQTDGYFPTEDEAGDDPQKAELVLQKYDEVFNLIRVEKGENSDHKAVKKFLADNLDGSNEIIEVLRKAEKLNLIKIAHIPSHYTDDLVLKSKYNLDFQTKEELNEFLTSPAVEKVWAKDILHRARNLDASTILSLLKKFAHKLKLSKIDNLFADDSFLNKLKTGDKQKILEQVINELERETQRFIERDKEREESFGIDWDESNVKPRLNYLKEAASQGIFLTDYKERLKNIQEATYHYNHLFSGRAIGRERDSIAETEVLLDKMSSKKDKITGEGLEFVELDSPGRKVYLNGKLVCSMSGAEFSEKPTNGETVAWVIREVIGQCKIKGTQNRDVVYAWKKGSKTPVILFEEHAWSSEKYFRVFAPEVNSNGTIKVDVKINNQIETKEFTF